MDAASRSPILVLGNEDVFLDFLQAFAAGEYLPLYAQDCAEASARCKDHRPRLLVIPLAGRTLNQDLVQTLKLARESGAKILALGIETPPPALASLVDRCVSGSDPEQHIAVAAELLGERRAMPRAVFGVPVNVRGLGTLQATVISGKSLFIPTSQPLQVGQMVQVGVDSGAGVLSAWANVTRVGTGQSGDQGMVLTILPQGREVRTYLNGLVRGLIMLGHVDQVSDAADEARLPENVVAKLAQRSQKELSALRSVLTAQMTFTEALNERLMSLAEDQSREVKWKDVQPELARKMSAQRELIRSILARVEALAANQAASKELQDALHEQAELHGRISEQEAVIEELRARLDGLSRVQEDSQLQASLRAQQALEERVAAQAEAINHLMARVDQLSRDDRTRDVAETSRGHLREHAEQIAALSPQLQQLKDRQRLGMVDTDELDLLTSKMDVREQELLHQADVLGGVGVGQWAPIPEMPEVDPASAALVRPQAPREAPREAAPREAPREIPRETPREAAPREAAPREAPVRQPARPARPLMWNGPPAEAESGPEPVVEASKPRWRWGWVLLVGCAAVAGIGAGVLVLVSGVLPGSSSAPPGNSVAASAPPRAVVPDTPPRVHAPSPDLGSGGQASADAAPAAADRGPAVDSAAAPSPPPPVVQETPSQRRKRQRRQLIERAAVLVRKGDQAASREYLTRALKLSDDHAVRALLARSHEQAGEFWPAIHHLTKAVEMSPSKLRPDRLVQLGQLYLKVGQRAKACARFNEALQQQASHPRASQLALANGCLH